jgi:hypothetical protein
MVALDSNALTKLIDAVASITGPQKDHEYDAKLALVRSFFYLPPECCFHYTPTVEIEYLRIRDEAKLGEHLSWIGSQFCMVNPPPNHKEVETHAHELNKIHVGSKKFNDCKILAECEASFIMCLISCDDNFVRKFRNYISNVRLCTPVDYWNSLGIKQGALPQRLPHPANPLARETWWLA